MGGLMQLAICGLCVAAGVAAGSGDSDWLLALDDSHARAKVVVVVRCPLLQLHVLYAQKMTVVDRPCQF